jgi:hypothetical protein
MVQVGALAAVEPEDPGYPNTSAPDPLYPCQTLEPIGAPLDGIATPFMWSRLAGPLARALEISWQSLGLLRRARPASWVSIHFGRIAVNAHAWERLRALWAGEEPDPALIPPPPPGLARLPERVERVRVALRRGKLDARVDRARHEAERSLLRARGRDPRELEPADLARGPLDDAAWTEAFLPWIFAGVTGMERERASDRVQVGVVLEQRFSTELGRRLSSQGQLRSPIDAAYLTQEERLAAVHERSPAWRARAEERAARIARFVELEVPARFWGRPRVGDAAR